MTHELEAIDSFEGQSAVLSGHLFENARAGVIRGLYWMINVKCKPIQYAGETWEPGVAAEWLTLGSANDLHGASFTSGNQDMGECSFYVWQHDRADKWEFNLLRADAESVYRLNYKLNVDFIGVDNDDVSGLQVSGSAPLHVGSLVVVRDNVSPKPNSHDEARAMIKPHFPEIQSWSDVVEAEVDGDPIAKPWRYCFSPNRN